jgi:hypothetical protein
MDVFIPETPAQRQYSCPNCKHNVKGFRVGNSSSYLVMDADDESKEHDCKGKNGKLWKGAIPITLLGYKPPKKEKKDESQSGTKTSAGQ